MSQNQIQSNAASLAMKNKTYFVTIRTAPDYDTWRDVLEIDIPSVVRDFAEAGNDGYIDDGDTEYCVHRS